MLGAILGAITGIPALITAGENLYSAIAGKPVSQPGEATSLGTDVQTLPPDQQAQWAAAMQSQLEMYRAQSDRLKTEEGEVTADVLKALPPDAAKEVALLRMTTRPLVVRWMAHALLLPLYAMLVDFATALINVPLKALGSEAMPLLGASMMKDGSVYAALYGQVTTPAAAIVISYMLLREIGKATGQGDGGGIGQAAGGLLNAVAGIIGKARGK